MKAIIIAAGYGNRLGKLTAERPKAMVQVEGRELILRLMDFLDAAEFTERIVVTGYRSETLSNFLQRNRPEVKVLYNPHFSQGSVKTIEVALPYLDDEFLLMNVDHLYPRRMLTEILKYRQRGLMAICDFDRELMADDMKVKLDDKRRLTTISKTLEKYDGGYIGMTYCGKEMLKTYHEAVQETLKLEGSAANVEAILRHLAEGGAPIEIFDASGIGWSEIDTPEDLQRATKILKGESWKLIR